MKRRQFLAGAAALAASPTIHPWAGPASATVPPLSFAELPVISPQQQGQFLEDLQSRCYRFFVEAADPNTGLVSDRAAVDGSWYSTHASSAACGFAMAAHAAAAEAGWVPRAEAADRCRLTLESLVDKAEHVNGFVYHFFDRRDGRRMMDCEASSIDTALMIAGSISAATTFADDKRIVELADYLYRRVDWQFMLGDNNLLYMGWNPETGMLPHQWDTYSELIILVLLAIGAPANAIPGECWQAWRREPVLDFEGTGFLTYPPLFVHQYPMAFFDFRGYRSPSGRSYWDNAVTAHRAQIAFMTELGRRNPDQFGHYGPNLWGLTSSDSAEGYRDWGGPYEAGRFEPDRGIDGSVVPSAAAGGLPIVPNESVRTLTYQRDKFGDLVYGKYGFVNVFHPEKRWAGNDVIGIDTGISLLQAENLRTGGVWDAFMRHPAAKQALQKSGFSPA